MLFTTAIFALAFLPTTLVGFFLLAKRSHLAAASWLFAASLFFYGYWMPEYIALLLGSICGNFLVGKQIASCMDAASSRAGKRWMWAGITANLGVLGYYKYAGFFANSIDAALGTDWNTFAIVLPIGISFFTFTQIAFLVDCYQKGTREYGFIHYGLFVTYFPHLVAGPILHHAQMMPQFGYSATYRFDAGRFAGGLGIFGIGLFKKIVLADGISPYADAIFNAADAGANPDYHEAWLGTLAYTFQLYFDFSGYSDMAIGLSWMFNIRLPFNFDSPYRATSISDFWRRWHMSLSAFLRDYLYIALGGNRLGSLRRHVNLAITMVLGGLWHGASWSFVLWGGLHGLYLIINHLFRSFCGESLSVQLDRSRIAGAASWMLTILVVILAWVPFRAETMAGAERILLGMIGLTGSNGIHPILWNEGLHGHIGFLWCLALAIVALWPKNSNHIGTALLAACEHSALVRHMTIGAAAVLVLLLIALNTARGSVSAFIYFNF